jgi:hypothetical protein
MQTFTDLVGTTAVPAHCFDIDELTELTPALDTAQATHDTAEQASGAANSGGTQCHSYFQITCPF